MPPTTTDAARPSAFGRGKSRALAASLKVTALRRELATLRTGFQDAVRLLHISRGDLLTVREEAIHVAEEYRTSSDMLVASNERLGSSNKELLAIISSLQDLLERSGISFGNPFSVACVDLRPLLSSWMNDQPAGVVRLAEKQGDANIPPAWQENAARRMADLTPRQREIMVLVVKGWPSKIIAADLHISQRTVECHRASIMKKTGSKSLPALTRLALFALPGSTDELLEVA
jgi:two-component system CheB/CheR fusion protein